MEEMSHIDEGVPSIDRIQSVQPIGQEPTKTVVSTPFKSFMQPTAAQNPQTSSVPSPFELSRNAGHAIAGKPTIDSVVAQINRAHQESGEAKNYLNTPKLQLTKADKFLLNNKLSDAKTHINAATSKVGVPIPPTQDSPPSANPVVKFLQILTDGQYQLQAAKEQLETMKHDGKSMNAGELLLMQVKLGKAQTEIEYSSVLLSKAVDTTKQLYNVQI